MKNKLKKVILKLILLALLLLMLYPLWFLLFGSFMGSEELAGYLYPLKYSSGEGYVSWPFLPRQPELWSWISVLLDTPEFFASFWNTVKVTAITTAGQTATAVLAAWGLSMYRVYWGKWLTVLYTLLMMMPFQVFMLPEYFVLKKTNLFDTHWALILPMIFSPFAVFLLLQNFKSLPAECLEAARLDGASEWVLFWKIGIAHAKPGIVTVAVLCFVQCWSMVEQPLAFLETKSLTLLSQYLPQVEIEEAGAGLAQAVLSVVPCVLVLLVGAEYFTQGILAKQDEGGAR